jgi:hypothetical protein
VSDLITRLNCSNCKFVSTLKVLSISSDELNLQGGIKDASKEERARAQKVRLITLPGKAKIAEKHWCNQSDVDQWITEHMWCRKWEATGTIHPK